MRNDSIGIFWEEATRSIRGGKGTKKPKTKAEPPYPFWLDPDYLPGLDEAREQRGIDRMTMADWMQTAALDQPCSWDTETYEDYFAVGWRNLVTNKVDWVEMTADQSLDVRKLQWILANVRMRGFNSDRYDEIMVALAAGGCDNHVLKLCSDDMIVRGKFGIQLLREYRCHRLEFRESVDLMEVAPGKGGLKVYMARINERRLQDLPFAPYVTLGPLRRQIVRHYMHNDTAGTGALAIALKGAIDLREQMSQSYGVNLLAASDAKIAETVLRTMYERKTGEVAHKNKVPVGTAYRYNAPDYLEFRSPVMRQVFDLIKDTWFVVGENGKVSLPKELTKFKIRIGKGVYTMGIGGLHSNEKTVAHYTNEDYELLDSDVESFYPRVIINQGLYPKHLGPALLEVYNEIVNTRLAAKASGDMITSEILKIVINSSFGKFGNKYSVLYSPDFLIQTTISGQLSLLMLIDALESVGIEVISANTDGIVTKARRDQIELRDRIFAWWQKTCQFKLDYKKYEAIYSRDVNNYYAISREKDGSIDIKRKGEYAKESMKTTPSANICADAVAKFLTEGVPVEDTIIACNDIRKFVIVQEVKRGAVWRDQFLGKVCRWYWSNSGDRDRLIGVEKDNKVPQSDASRPLMDFTEEFPDDINFDAYIEHARKILVSIGL